MKAFQRDSGGRGGAGNNQIGGLAGILIPALEQRRQNPGLLVQSDELVGTVRGSQIHRHLEQLGHQWMARLLNAIDLQTPADAVQERAVKQQLGGQTDLTELGEFAKRLEVECKQQRAPIARGRYRRLALVIEQQRQVAKQFAGSDDVQCCARLRLIAKDLKFALDQNIQPRPFLTAPHDGFGRHQLHDTRVRQQQLQLLLIALFQFLEKRDTRQQRIQLGHGNLTNLYYFHRRPRKTAKRKGKRPRHGQITIRLLIAI